MVDDGRSWIEVVIDGNSSHAEKFDRVGIVERIVNRNDGNVWRTGRDGIGIDN